MIAALELAQRAVEAARGDALAYVVTERSLTWASTMEGHPQAAPVRLAHARPTARLGPVPPARRELRDRKGLPESRDLPARRARLVHKVRRETRGRRRIAPSSPASGTRTSRPGRRTCSSSGSSPTR